MKKLIRKLDKTLIAARLRFGELMSKEDGMETLETVIVVIIAIIIAGVVINMIGSHSEEGTLLNSIYKKIDEMIQNLGS